MVEIPRLVPMAKTTIDPLGRPLFRVLIPLVFFLSILLPMGLWAQATPGQTIRGRVMAVGDTVGLEGAELSLTDSVGTVLSRSTSNDRGLFVLRVPSHGRVRFRATRLGYREVEAELVVQQKEMVEVEVRMDVEAIRLDPLVVTARREIRQGTLDEFYDRMARMKEKGRGQFLTLEQIENFGGMEIALLLQTLPGVWAEHSGMGNGYSVQLRSMGRPCSPDMYLDGLPMSASHLFPGDLEGVEVYSGPFEPVDGYWTSRCGVVFLWRKKDWGIPFTVKATLFAAIGGALWYLLPTLF